MLRSKAMPPPRDGYHLHPMDLLETAIAAVVEENPDLSSAGWRTLSGSNSGEAFEQKRRQMRLPNFREMVFDAILMLALRRHPAGSNSYGARNSAGHEIGRYISNGAYIVAAILAGYVPVRPHNLGPNCYFRKPRDAELHPALRGGDYDRGGRCVGDMPDPGADPDPFS